MAFEFGVYNWACFVFQFAEAACGNITVILNGSIKDAFNRRRYELWSAWLGSFEDMHIWSVHLVKASQVYVNASCLLLSLSMFGGVELDSLNPRMVNHVNIKVVTNLEGPYMWESGFRVCGKWPDICNLVLWTTEQTIESLLSWGIWQSTEEFYFFFLFYFALFPYHLDAPT